MDDLINRLHAIKRTLRDTTAELEEVLVLLSNGYRDRYELEADEEGYPTELEQKGLYVHKDLSRNPEHRRKEIFDHLDETGLE